MTESPTLFSSTDDDAPHSPAQGPFAAVAMEQSVDRTLDYGIPPRLLNTLRVGQRVRAPLGRNNRPAFGYVVAIRQQTDAVRIKPLIAVDDERILLMPQLLELARWMSRYYVAPLGVVLESILPSAVRKRIGLGYSQMVRLARERTEAQAALEKTRAPKRRAVIARLLQLEPGAAIELPRLASEAGTTPATVRKLLRLGLITITAEADLAGLTGGLHCAGDESDLTLNEEQQRVVDEMLPRIAASGFSVNLLLGVTGSGKTEVYLRCIRETIERGKRAIVLVPEIALTSQTVRRFTARFANVAILHSGLSATQRHRFWQQISTGKAQVVVGARSAVFAPMPDVGLIVVDEEHESSYKQDTAPRYHARDVAIKRAQLEGIPILLGSATPSLETYYRAQANTSPTNHLLTLNHRVRGLQLPHVEVVDMKQEGRFRRGIHLISQRLERLLGATVESGRQAILLLNRRGYSNFVYCPSCTNLLKCRFCDTTMTYHRSAAAHAKGGTSAEGVHTGQLHCHYCLAVSPLPEKCPQCGKKLSLFGLGTQRVEEELARKFPTLKFARVDSDSMRSARDYETLLGRFARNELQVMLGTQMIAKGLDYPNVTLVGVISGDTALALPDFRAAERTVQLITQVAGRAGRGDAAGRVIVQTFQPEDAAIQSAIRQDFVGFANQELPHRKEIGLPPYSRMVRIILRDQDPEKLTETAEKLAGQIGEAVALLGVSIRLRGPMPCPINRIAGYWRQQIVMHSATPGPLQQVLAAVREKGHLARGDRIAVDVDPVSLL
jgi:primosomal protein N' (replication factor Y)